MKITKAKFKELSKIIGYDIPFLNHVWNQMIAGNPQAELLDEDTLIRQMTWVKEQNISTIEMYDVKIKAIIEEVKSKSIIVPKEDNEAEMKALYKKLGYNNKEIKKVKVVEKNIRVTLTAMITDFMSQSNQKGLDITDLKNVTESIIFKDIDVRWRNLARNYIIKEYPKAKSHPEIRTRLTNLFKTKLLQSLGHNKANETTKALDEIDAKDDELEEIAMQPRTRSDEPLTEEEIDSVIDNPEEPLDDLTE